MEKLIFGSNFYGTEPAFVGEPIAGDQPHVEYQPQAAGYPPAPLPCITAVYYRQVIHSAMKTCQAELHRNCSTRRLY